MEEKLKRGAFYLVADRPSDPLKPGQAWRARWTGEKRPPAKGEYYLSGAMIRAYRSGGLKDSYYIAELVRVQCKTLCIEEVLT